MDPIRILIVDDSPDFLDVAVGYLAGDPAIQVAGRALSGEEGIKAVQTLAPDVVLMDVMLPQMNGIAATRQIMAALVGVKIIALSVYDAPRYREVMHQAGAIAYFSKDRLPDELVSVLRAVV